MLGTTTISGPMMRILLAEDDALLGDALQVGLRQAGFDVDWARDGIAAEHALAGAPYAALVLDLGLPRRSGDELLARLRAKDERLPVLILTARELAGDDLERLGEAVTGYLHKNEATQEQILAALATVWESCPRPE